MNKQINVNDPWGGASSTQSDSTWLSKKVETEAVDTEIFKDPMIPMQEYVENSLDWVVENFRDFFQVIKTPIDMTLTSIQSFFQDANPFILIAFFTLIAWQVGNKKLAIGTFLSLLFIGIIGMWDNAMITLALVFTSVIFSVLMGIPLGICAAKNKKVSMVLKPLLDAMQTTPAFVYLIPIVMLFGIGNVPGVVVTIIFALPPLIRLTSLGISQVPKDLIEASHAFGASPMQMLFKVELPIAMPTIMAGVNQTLMLSLSMVVIASMIAVGGLGQSVLRGIGRLDMGLAAVGGVSIVILAIILDRLTQSMAKKDKNNRSWYMKEPIGLIFKFIKRSKDEKKHN